LKCGTRWASDALKNTLNEDPFASDEEWLKYPQYYLQPCRKLKKIPIVPGQTRITQYFACVKSINKKKIPTN
jgi:hypothetical protein